MPAPPLIRVERRPDESAIRQLLQAAFPTSLESALVDKLRSTEDLVVSLVAELAEEIVGYAGLSRVTTDRAELKGLGLAPVAVAPEHQCRGIGSALIRQALEEARLRSYPLVVVLGEPSYYSRFGFVPASRFGLANEYGVDDQFMVHLLSDETDTRGAGVARYAPAFSLFV